MTDIRFISTKEATKILGVSIQSFVRFPESLWNFLCGKESGNSHVIEAEDLE